MSSLAANLEQSSPNTGPGVKTDGEESCYISRRYIVAAMCFFGLIVVLAMRVIIIVAIVSMVTAPEESSPANSTDVGGTCPSEAKPASSASSASNKGKTYDWDEQTQAIILSGIMYGYVIGQLPAGLLAVRFGGKMVLLSSAALASLFTFLSPVAAEGNVILLIICRCGVGLAASGVQPSIHTLLAKWIPLDERTKVSALVYTGMDLGCIIGASVTGVLCDSDFLGGWPAAFYVIGLIGMVWTLVAIFTVYESPSVYPGISEREAAAISKSIGTSVQKNLSTKLIPWKDILKSPPVWAIIAATFGQSWCGYALIQQIPTYFSDMYGVSTTTSGFITTAAFLASWIFSTFFGFLAGIINKKDYLSPTGTRKLLQVISLGAYTVECLCLAYAVNCNYAAAISVFSLGLGLNGAMFAAFYTNHIDLSPNYAAALWGLCTVLGAMASIISPLVGGSILKKQSTLENWRTIFDINAGVCVTATVIYLLFGSAEEQSWNKPRITQNVQNAIVDMSQLHISIISI